MVHNFYQNLLVLNRIKELKIIVFSNGDNLCSIWNYKYLSFIKDITCTLAILFILHLAQDHCWKSESDQSNYKMVKIQYSLSHKLYHKLHQLCPHIVVTESAARGRTWNRPWFHMGM